PRLGRRPVVVAIRFGIVNQVHLPGSPVEDVQGPDRRRILTAAFGGFDRRAAPLVRQQGPELPAAGGRKQSRLPVADTARVRDERLLSGMVRVYQELQHVPQVAAAFPLLRRHGVTLTEATNSSRASGSRWSEARLTGYPPVPHT